VRDAEARPEALGVHLDVAEEVVDRREERLRRRRGSARLGHLFLGVPAPFDVFLARGPRTAVPTPYILLEDATVRQDPHILPAFRERLVGLELEVLAQLLGRHACRNAFLLLSRHQSTSGGSGSPGTTAESCSESVTQVKRLSAHDAPGSSQYTQTAG